jgi:hypothetical protein
MREDLQCGFQPGLHFRVAAIDTAHRAVVDICVGREDVIQVVVIALIDCTAVVDHKLLDFQAVRDFLQG